MYRILLFLFLVSFIETRAQSPDPNLFVADPFILEDNGTYYLYGTGSPDGIVAWRSTDLVHWDGPCGATAGLALHKDDSWGERMFWAPEVYKINGKYVMTYSVEEHIAVAEASSPLGPFIQSEKKPLLDEKGIDSHIFMDDDGTPHLYWVRFQGGNIIYTARMSRDLKTVDMSTARLCITPEPGTWERTDAEPRANVAEGPFVMKRGSKYYLSYSCNHYQSPDYAVGWAVADKPEGPWTRNRDNPILLRHNGYVGTGHHAFLRTSSGKIYIVYHAHYSAQSIAPRRTLISECRWNKGPGFVKVDPGSTELVKVAKNPEMYFSDSSSLGRPLAKDPKVVYYKGRYLMYYSVPANDRKGWSIGVAESNDLTHWNKVGDIHPAAGYEKNGLCAPGAIIRGDTLHLFYQTYGNGPKDAICHAFSTDGIHFVRNATNPVFRPTGTWNNGRAIDAEVTLFNNRYFLYFATRDPSGTIQMQGVAVTSPHSSFNRDSWVQAVDSSILKPSYPWEKKCIEAAACITVDGKLYMFYAGGYNNEPQQVGVAVSNDGLAWKRLSTRPFLTNGAPGTWNESESGHPDIFRAPDGRTYLFFQGNNDKGKTWYLSRLKVKWINDKPVIDR